MSNITSSTINGILVITMLIALTGCVEAGEESVSDRNADYAYGPVVAMHVDANGNLVCTKSDGKKWSSAKGGQVDFYVDGEFAGQVTYPPQTEQNSVYSISLAGVTEDLAPGTHKAVCVAVPYIDIPKGSEGWQDPPCSQTAPDRSCTVSGTYVFDVGMSGKPTYQDRCPTCPAWCDPSHPNHQKMIEQKPNQCEDKDYPGPCGEFWDCAYVEEVSYSFLCNLQNGFPWQRKVRGIGGFNHCANYTEEEFGGSPAWYADFWGNLVTCPVHTTSEATAVQCCPTDGCHAPAP